MKFGPVPLDQAEGRILGHNVAGPDGKRLLRKGKALRAEDVESLRRLGRHTVYVAELERGDVDENVAAQRIAQAALGPGLRLSGASTGRVNLVSTVLGVFRFEGERLRAVNASEGVTVASLTNQAVVRPGQTVATVKVIPYAVPEYEVERGEAVSREGGPLLRVDALPRRRVGLVLSGSPSVRSQLTESFTPLVERVAALGSDVVERAYAILEEERGEEALAETLLRQRRLPVDLILLAGETAIMDRHDITPRAVERAGGRIVSVGAPVDPGNLLMLAYIEDVPVLGAPGCARSRKVNVVDWVLPRLLVGDRLSREDIIAFGAGGLL
ncbi:MAG: molybdopterin-binding protein, partial [Vicinamibacteria bacterium]